MKNQQYRLRKAIIQSFLYTFLVVGGFLTLFPFIWMFLSTFKTEAEIFSVPPTLLPSSFQFDNYVYIWNSLGNFPRFLFNSVFVTASVVILNLFFDSLAAFAFAKLKFPGRDNLFSLFLATMLVPGQVLLIELYRIIQNLGWINSYQALILPSAMSAFGIFLIWQYMKNIPDDFLEAARMDGANDFDIYLRIYMPLSAPAMAVLAIFTFIGTWNDFLWPLIVTNSEELRTLVVGLALMQGNNVMHWTWLMTGAFISVAPVILFYILAQRYFIAGLTAGGVKG
ncbi:MAG TPA: carbohydrate ABC transporter permease [Anaerolineaceae bacterium]|nr:carbohydrate ABC transporter permease [Anaerolineaceae bacterium]HPN53610.1 carbohydrate ABC transporter permease [Anaerolineaceae bacterium]